MVKRETGNLHEELMQLVTEDDVGFGIDWIGDISFNVNKCSSEINEQLISRRNDPPSNTMSKASFVEEYLTGSLQEEISNGGI